LIAPGQLGLPPLAAFGYPLRRLRSRQRWPHRTLSFWTRNRHYTSTPLGLVADQTYELVHGRLAPEERLVMLSDGVPEARSHSGELYGFERLSGLTLMTAREIAEAAQAFGQEDDITVLTLAIGAS